MSKVKIQCLNCGKQYRTEHPEIVIRFCKNCNQETEFERVEKKPIITRQKSFDIVCLKCQNIRHVQTIPKQCGHCGQRFQQHAENSTLTDIIFNAIVGSDKEKGYMKVTVGRDGMVWWTPPKDVYGDYSDDPSFIGDSKKISSSSYQGESMRTDDLTPVRFGQTTTKKRFIK